MIFPAARFCKCSLEALAHYSYKKRSVQSRRVPFFFVMSWFEERAEPLTMDCVLDSPHAAHMHPPPMPGQGPPQGPPGGYPPDVPGPIDAISVHRMNEMMKQQHQGIGDRLEADARGYDSVFSQ